VKTQAYGITVALVGNQSPYANVIIEGNDVTGNKMGGILNNASSFTGFVIRNNAGFNPLGAIPAPAFPASATALINDTGYDATVYITSGTNSITIAIGGTTLTGVSVAGGGAVSGPIRLPANQKITLTYAAVEAGGGFDLAVLGLGPNRDMRHGSTRGGGLHGVDLHRAARPVVQGRWVGSK